MSVVKDSYYENFTKYAMQDQNVEKTPNVAPVYSYRLWTANPESVRGLTIVELKSALKSEGCRVSGKRDVLVRRLVDRFTTTRSVIAIQRIFRGYIARESERIRGPTYRDRSKCVNETDFQTMDSVEEIPHECFFSYSDDRGFVYGFNVFSLMTMFKRNRRFINPYNREDIPISDVCRIFSLYKKIEILYPLVFVENGLDNVETVQYAIEDAVRDTVDFAGITIPDTFEIEDDSEYQERYSSPSEDPLYSDCETPYAALQESLQIVSPPRMSEDSPGRVHSLFRRIQELVGDPGILSEWFTSLSKNEYDRFYHFYYIWWSRSNSLTDFEKREICAAEEPFPVLSQIDENWTLTQYRVACLDLIELMVYTGITMEKCRVGAEQVITMMSVVSKPARRARPDLFDRLS